MDYLQYINTVRCGDRPGVKSSFLVSGLDPVIRQIIGQNIVSAAYNSGRTLFILDNTQHDTGFNTFGAYRVTDILNGEIDLCEDLLEVSGFKEISRLRSLLISLGFDSGKAMKVVNYLQFVKEIERRLGNYDVLTPETLEQYGGMELVKWKLHTLLDRGQITAESCDYLLARYSEVSAAAADFEMLLVLLAPFMGGSDPVTAGMAVHMPVGDFEADRQMQSVICTLMMSYIRKNADTSAVLILDNGKGECGCIMDILRQLPLGTDVHLLSSDIFALEQADLNVVMNTFPVRVYSRHDSMASCEKIEAACGCIEVVKHSYSTAVDRRFHTNSAFDMLLGTNRTDSEICNAPVKEARYRREFICALPQGAAIIDCGGMQTLFQF